MTTIIAIIPVMPSTIVDLMSNPMLDFYGLLGVVWLTFAACIWL